MISNLSDEGKRDIIAEFRRFKELIPHRGIAIEVPPLPYRGRPEGKPTKYHRLWPKLRRLVMQRDRVCQRCGEDDKEVLIVHHIIIGGSSADKGTADWTMLVVVCNKCHSQCDTRWDIDKRFRNNVAMRHKARENARNAPKELKMAYTHLIERDGERAPVARRLL